MPKTMFIGASPISLGSGKPCPVAATGPTLSLYSDCFIFFAVARAYTSRLTTPFSTSCTRCRGTPSPSNGVPDCSG